MSVTLSPLSPEGELNIGPHRSPAEFMRDLRMAVHEKKNQLLSYQVPIINIIAKKSAD